MSRRGEDTIEAMSPKEVLGVETEALRALCAEFRVSELLAFGSVLRDDFDEASDLDLLVTFEPGARVGLFQLARLRSRLESMTGRSVDLIPKDGLTGALRDEVLEKARLVYAA